MSEAGSGRAGEPLAAPRAAATAGSLLREARQAQGLHIAALAAAIKVTPRKLELLEADRLDELPDATFARALAQTVCRSLKVDAAPILALLPPGGGYRLEQLGEGLNMPFRERPGRLVPREWASLASPAIWAPALLLLAAGVVYLLPAGLLRAPAAGPRAASQAEPRTGPSPVSAPASEPATSTTEVVTAPAGAIRAETAPAATEAAASAAALPPASNAATADPGSLQVSTTAESWVGVSDARGQALIGRTLHAGESVGLDGATPLTVTIGNVTATHLVFRGKPVELAAFARGNVARLELK